MRRSTRPIIIASRRSALAKAQTQAIGAALRTLHPDVAVEYKWMESEGDLHRDQPLADAGGKGLFARAIERALLRSDADLAVHSLKDLPTQLTPGLMLVAIPEREDPRDCLIAPPEVQSLTDLPVRSLVGTASPRRAAQLLRVRPDLRIELLRGNVDSRLRKVLEEKRCNATLLACAGLHRLGLREHARLPLDIQTLLPAAGQGALALQCRVDDHVTISRCLPLNSPAAAEAVHAERAVVDALQGDCSSAIAVHAYTVWLNGQQGWRLQARVLSPDGSKMASADDQAAAGQTQQLVRQVVSSLQEQGARELLVRGG